MDRYLNREAVLERVWAKAEQTEDELGQLHKWKSIMEKKFDLLEQARKELEQRTEDGGSWEGLGSQRQGSQGLEGKAPSSQGGCGP